MRRSSSLTCTLRCDEPDDGILVGEDADDIGAALDLAVEALKRIGRVQLGTVRGWEAHIGEHIGHGVIQQAPFEVVPVASGSHQSRNSVQMLGQCGITDVWS